MEKYDVILIILVQTIKRKQRKKSVEERSLREMTLKKQHSTCSDRTIDGGTEKK